MPETGSTTPGTGLRPIRTTFSLYVAARDLRPTEGFIDTVMLEENSPEVNAGISAVTVLGAKASSTIWQK
jgi:hypothetical protein